MSSLCYRPYGPEDAQAVKAIMDEAFHIHRYVTAPRLMNSVLEVYLRDYLLKSSYARVALKDRQVVGVLLGRVAGQPLLPGAFGNRMRSWAHRARLALLGFGHYRSLRHYLAFERVFEILRSRTCVPLENEIVAFAVSSSARGLGAGRTLYNSYLEQLRRHRQTGYYLYTDELCTYGFYVKHGMTETAGYDMPVRLDDRPQTLGVYLYTGTVD
ncbi:Acetyltransferase (GNAT) family protein [Propionibacterium cyclohexanicum]|uniref:Acetyltransferase (GNAT) family protein n=1 Tax=Propionibacterium cyclohexanicum TaxID=64702 RepID=A0A1H9U193_9ACTN|nr:GNAT family N-acetyltransferase [Propionibacterium cyclohexanicum]SES03235.1 Acetyltransferase (GNAT) family protein [Propionibacterium cyclohexanicum]